MPTLVLIRHAKAGPHAPEDYSRHLAPRGREDAADLRRWLDDVGVVPGRVVVSTAARARETWEYCGVGSVVPEYDDRVYEASTADLREVIAETATDIAVLVLVGHNPGIERLAWELDDTTEARDSTNAGMATSGVAVFELADWTAEHGQLVAWR